ncbi:MAG TPA: hypothetical protein VN783_05615 [Thermoanaerobaculia bacterium]|nr:hypothetical protein [Thermoanaerobaculia bacterium]
MSASFARREIAMRPVAGRCGACPRADENVAKAEPIAEATRRRVPSEDSSGVAMPRRARAAVSSN